MADEKVNASPEEKKAPEALARPGRAIRPRRNTPGAPLSLVGIRRLPLMRSPPLGNTPSRPFSPVWERTLPRRPAR